MKKENVIDFLIVGAQKAGTSALDQYLRSHAQIKMARRKEVHFFDNENFFKKEAIDYSNYHKFFDWSESNILRGECTPIYMYWNLSIRRIFQYNPKIKIIACLRNPIERAFSSWSMETSRDKESLSFKEAISQELVRCRASLPFQNRNFSYIDRGFYSEQIRRIWRYFPIKQTMFIKYDDLLNSRNIVLSQISDFLEINEFPETNFNNVNPTQYSTTINEVDRKYLNTFFQYEIKQLEQMLNWNCATWL